MVRKYDSISLRKEFENKFVCLSMDLSKRFNSEHLIILIIRFSMEELSPLVRVLYSAPIISKDGAFPPFNFAVSQFLNFIFSRGPGASSRKRAPGCGTFR